MKHYRTPAIAALSIIAIAVMLILAHSRRIEAQDDPAAPPPVVVTVIGPKMIDRKVIHQAGPAQPGEETTFDAKVLSVVTTKWETGIKITPAN